MKGAHFFCENCGAEVARDAKRCQTCGKFFSSIRCPSCGFAGEEFLFDQGCPVCGYSAPENAGQGAAKSAAFGASRRTGKAAGALPWWVYALTALAVSLVFVVFFWFSVLS
jgi:predicted RNA-binding Zn-ribbon protein involved in translation (DUF1610 family)